MEDWDLGYRVGVKSATAIALLIAAVTSAILGITTLAIVLAVALAFVLWRYWN